MPTEYYERTRRNSRIQPTVRDIDEKTQGSKLGRLFLKQFLAAAIFTLVIYGAANSSLPFLNNCADALGRAIRYETDFIKLKDQFLEYLPNPFHSATPQGSTEEATPNSQTTPQ